MRKSKASAAGARRVAVLGPEVDDLGLGEDQVLDLLLERREHAGAAHPGIQLARDGQHGVADALGVEPAAVHPAEQGVLGVLGRQLGDGLARLAIGRRGHHQPVDRLEPPAAGDQLGGEPVEQLGMRGRLAPNAEIARRRHDPPAEMVLPEPVDDHPGRQGIVGLGEPAGQGRPAAGLVAVPGRSRPE